MGRLKQDINALEAECLKQQRLLQELQQENEQYKQKESALLSTLLTLQCGMSALAPDTEVPAQQESSRISSPRADASASDAGFASGTAGGHDSSPGLSPSMHPLTDAAAHNSPAAAAAGGSAELSDEYCAAAGQQQQQQTGLDAIRGRLMQLEQMLQGALQEVCSLAPSTAPCRALASSSSSSTGDLLPSTRLRALATDPARVAAYLALDTQQRSQWLAAAVTRMGLLLPKYTAVPAARQQVDALAEEVAARGLTYAWLEPSSCITHDLNRLNMETGQQEDAYPDGMWQFVLQSLELTPQQALSMQALWSRVKDAQASLLCQHEALTQQLTSLQQQQQQQQLLFGLEAEQLPIMEVAQALALCEPEAPFATHQQQQQRRVDCSTPRQQHSRGVAQHGQHHRHGHHLSQQQQQQQQLKLQPQQHLQQQRRQQVKLEQQQQQQLLLHVKLEPQPQQSPPLPSLQQQQQQMEGVLLPDGCLAAECRSEVLLVHPCGVQLQLEAQLSRLRSSLVVLEKLMLGQMLNGLSLRQLAVLLVSSWPYCPDLVALYGVLDEVGSPT